MATRGFDDSNIAWNTLEGIPDVWYHILDIDDANRIVDILFKFSARSKIVLHRHRTEYRTFVIQGELRLYNAENELTEVRKVGSYVAKAAGGEPHREGGGDEDVIAIFSNSNVEGPVYELLDDELRTVVTLGYDEFKELLRQQNDRWAMQIRERGTTCGEPSQLRSGFRLAAPWRSASLPCRP